MQGLLKCFGVNYLGICLLLIVGASLSACKKKTGLTTLDRPNITTTDIVRDTAFENIFTAVKAQQIEYRQFSMRCKVNYDDGSMKQDFTANVRITKDSIIWLSLTGIFNIEGARMVIRPDSFFLLNKLTREYTARPISSLQEVIPLSSGYDALQNLLIGTLVNVDPAERRLYQADSLAVLTFQNPYVRQTATVHRLNYTALELLLADQQIKQDLKITFGDYRGINGKRFPFLRQIEVNRGERKMKIGMEVQKYTINEPLTFPFDVNEGYKRI